MIIYFGGTRTQRADGHYAAALTLEIWSAGSRMSMETWLGVKIESVVEVKVEMELGITDAEDGFLATQNCWLVDILMISTCGEAGVQYGDDLSEAVVAASDVVLELGGGHLLW
jgi:hypothetical protein